MVNGSSLLAAIRLRITTPRLELRIPSDEDLIELAAATDDIHDPGRSPFSQPWSEKPSPERERLALQHHWKTRSLWSPSEWSLEFIVVLDGQVIGSQGLNSKEFAITREATTGSWLNRKYQGRGLGTEMRAAVLFFAFDSLGAEVAITDFFHWNERSKGVTRKLGYSPNGQKTIVIDGKAVTVELYRMTRANWEQNARGYVPVTVENADACLELLGAARRGSN